MKFKRSFSDAISNQIFSKTIMKNTLIYPHKNQTVQFYGFFNIKHNLLVVIFFPHIHILSAQNPQSTSIINLRHNIFSLNFISFKFSGENIIVKVIFFINFNFTSYMLKKKWNPFKWNKKKKHFYHRFIHDEYFICWGVCFYSQ